MGVGQSLSQEFSSNPSGSKEQSHELQENGERLRCDSRSRNLELNKEETDKLRKKKV